MIDIEANADEAMQDKLAAKLEAFSNSLRKKRDEAVAARKTSGIEDEWHAAEDAYEGIDEANRGSQSRGKPSSHSGGYINSRVTGSGTRSTVLLNITRPYVDAASARVGDMLLPTDDRNWGIKTTPIADAVKGLADPQMLEQIMQMDAQRRAAAEGAEKQIDDWLTECQWHGEVRKMIDDCARLGTGILKGPTPTKVRRKKTAQEGGMLALVIDEAIVPQSKAVSPWNFFPDPDCGESIHDGSYVWECDTITAKGLFDLIGTPGYIETQLLKVLEQGPQSRSLDVAGMSRDKTLDSDVFEIWYFYGNADREDLIAAGVEVPDDGPITCPCLVTTVNGIVVRAALNPLDSGDFPFDVMPWQRRPGRWAGIGIPLQMATPQRMLTAAVRNMMDNSGLSSGPQIVMRKNAITPADGQWGISPRKVWWVNEGADVAAVNQAFLAVNIPTMQQELNNIIQLAMKTAEDVTGLPMLMQGQAGAQTPDTVGGMQILNNNASSVLRRIARLFDDYITEPHIRRYYEWLLMYGEDDSVKGDFVIDAKGSSALVERDLQNQAILQMGQLAANPAFGIDPEKWFKEMLKAQRLDPNRFMMDEEKKAQMAEMAQMQQPAPQIEAAKIRAEAELQKAQIAAQSAVQKMQIDTDRDRVYVEAQTRRDEVMAEAKFRELELKREIAMLEYATQEKISLETVKAKLTSDAMKLNLQRELAGVNAKAPQVIQPALEPIGRAPDGEAFQK